MTSPVVSPVVTPVTLPAAAVNIPAIESGAIMIDLNTTLDSVDRVPVVNDPYSGPITRSRARNE